VEGVIESIADETHDGRGRCAHVQSSHKVQGRGPKGKTIKKEMKKLMKTPRMRFQKTIKTWGRMQRKRGTNADEIKSRVSLARDY
jgi:hypothetical protein